MKIKSLVLTLLCFFVVVRSNESQANKITVEISIEEAKDESIKDRAKRLSSSYVVSLMLSGCVGAVTGSVVRYIEKKLNKPDSPIGFFLFVASWLYEPELRHAILTTLQVDFDSYGIAFTKDSMSRVAWIASWLAYLR